MKLDVGNKPQCGRPVVKLFADVERQPPLKAFYALPRGGSFKALLVSGEVAREPIEIDHCGEPRIGIVVLFHPQDEIALQLYVSIQPAPANAASLSSSHDGARIHA